MVKSIPMSQGIMILSAVPKLAIYRISCHHQVERAPVQSLSHCISNVFLWAFGGSCILLGFYVVFSLASEDRYREVTDLVMRMAASCSPR